MFKLILRTPGDNFLIPEIFRPKMFTLLSSVPWYCKRPVAITAFASRCLDRLNTGSSHRKWNKLVRLEYDDNCKYTDSSRRFPFVWRNVVSSNWIDHKILSVYHFYGFQLKFGWRDNVRIHISHTTTGNRFYFSMKNLVFLLWTSSRAHSHWHFTAWVNK